MKYISTLFVAIALFAVGTVNAQNASKLNSQSYTYVMKDIRGQGEEIHDKLTFGVAKVSSIFLGTAGYSEGIVKEKNEGPASDFEITFTSPKNGTYIFTGRAEGITIDGTVIVTDINGVQSNLAFRGMLTEEWDASVARNKGVQEDKAVEMKMKQMQAK